MKPLGVLALILFHVTDPQVLQARQTPGVTVAAVPTIKLPSQIFVEPGRPFRITCETNCKNLRWKTNGIEKIDDSWVNDPTRNFVGIAPSNPAQFRIEVLGTLNDQWAEGQCLLVVGPQPPAPTPPGPKPSDPLFAELQACYTADTGSGKVNAKNTLAALYRTAGMAAVNDQTVTTTGQLLTKFRAASKLLMKDDDIKELRLKLTSIISGELGLADVQLTEESRKKASAAFERIASLLEAIK